MECDVDFIGYIEESISAAEREKIETHLKTCTECTKELSLLKKSERLFNSILEKRPDFLCPDTDQLSLIVMGNVSLDEKKTLGSHVQSCPSCQNKITALQEAASFEMEMPPREQWKPLPEGLKAQIAEKSKSLRDQVKDALETLKSTGVSILTDVEELTDRLLSGPQEPLPAYALEREITMSSQTDLELRIPQEPFDFQIELENYTLQIKTVPSGVRIKVIKASIPASGIKVRIKKTSGEEVVTETDEKGVTVIKV